MTNIQKQRKATESSLTNNVRNKATEKVTESNNKATDKVSKLQKQRTYEMSDMEVTKKHSNNVRNNEVTDKATKLQKQKTYEMSNNVVKDKETDSVTKRLQTAIYKNLYKTILKQVTKALGNTTTSNVELDAYGFKHIKNYLGTFSKDTQPTTKPGDSYIYNDMNRGSIGRHWIAVYHNPTDNKKYTYDSYNRNLPGNDLGNGIPDQRYNQSNCGQRGMTALLMVQKYGVDALDNV